MKINRALQNLILSVAFVPTFLMAQTIQGTINLGGSSKVRVQLDTQNGNYYFNAEELKNPSFTVSQSDLAKIDCELTRYKVSKYSERPDIFGEKYYQEQGRTKFELRVLAGLNGTPNLDAEVKAWAETKGYRGQVRGQELISFSKPQVQFVFNAEALSVAAGTRITNHVQEVLRQSVVGQPNWRKLSDKGHLEFSLSDETLLCDILNRKVVISVSMDVHQSSLEQSAPRISFSEIETLSWEFSKHQLSLRNLQNRGRDAVVVTGAGLLALEAQDMGLRRDLFTSGIFSDIYFSLVASRDFLPKKLTRAEINEIVQKTVSTTVTPEATFTISNRELTLKGGSL